MYGVLSTNVALAVYGICWNVYNLRFLLCQPVIHSACKHRSQKQQIHKHTHADSLTRADCTVLLLVLPPPPPSPPLPPLLLTIFVGKLLPIYTHLFLEFVWSSYINFIIHRSGDRSNCDSAPFRAAANKNVENVTKPYRIHAAASMCFTLRLIARKCRCTTVMAPTQRMIWLLNGIRISPLFYIHIVLDTYIVYMLNVGIFVECLVKLSFYPVALSINANVWKKDLDPVAKSKAFGKR